eukprot:s1447_g16.t1
MMQLLCDMPSGPHNAEKERLLRELAATIDYRHEDARRQHYLKEAANFMIKRTHPGDLVMDSVGNQGSDPEPENPDDLPDLEELPEETNDNSDDTRQAVLPDLEELPEETNDNSDDTRQAVLLSGVTPVLEPRLEIARAAMQPTVYLDTRAGNCVDANRIAFAYAAYYVCRTIYKMWPGAIKWMTLPFDKMVERFQAGGRYDAMGTWPGSISEIDPETNISRDITDEEIRNSDATAGGELEDPDKWTTSLEGASEDVGVLINGEYARHGKNGHQSHDVEDEVPTSPAARGQVMVTVLRRTEGRLERLHERLLRLLPSSEDNFRQGSLSQTTGW